MANYNACCRSNYFKVKDKEKFKTFLQQLDLELIQDAEVKQVGFMTQAGLPSSFYDEEKAEDVEINFIDKLSKHLADDEVAIVMEVGYEKMRYLNGYAVAVNSKGEKFEISLGHINNLAAKLTTKPAADITECQY